MDLHAAQIQGFFDIPVDNLYAAPVFALDIKHQFDNGPWIDVMVVSPDVGGVARARELAKRIDAPLAIVDKRREKAGEVAEMTVIGDVTGKKCMIVDDICDTAGTLCKAAAGADGKGRRRGARLYHPRRAVGPGGRADHRLGDEIAGHHRHHRTDRRGPATNIRILPTAPIFAQAILNIWNGTSVSSLFETDTLDRSTRAYIRPRLNRGAGRARRHPGGRFSTASHWPSSRAGPIAIHAMRARAMRVSPQVRKYTRSKPSGVISRPSGRRAGCGPGPCPTCDSAQWTLGRARRRPRRKRTAQRRSRVPSPVHISPSSSKSSNRISSPLRHRSGARQIRFMPIRSPVSACASRRLYCRILHRAKENPARCARGPGSCNDENRAGKPAGASSVPATAGSRSMWSPIATMSASSLAASSTGPGSF